MGLEIVLITILTAEVSVANKGFNEPIEDGDIERRRLLVNELYAWKEIVRLGGQMVSDLVTLFIDRSLMRSEDTVYKFN